jgi:hypothetical protein
VDGPGRRRRSARLPLALALLAGALACSSAAPKPPVPEAAAPAPSAPGAAPPAAAPGRRVLLFPLNVVGLPLPSEVESGAEAVATELRATLESHGFAVESLGLGAANEAYLRAAMQHKQEVGAERLSLEGAASVLARQLAETHAFEVLLLPWIAMRAAQLEGRDVEWDGVERDLDLGKAKRARWMLGRLNIYVKAPSLQVLGYSPAGEKLFEGIGGLDLVEDADVDVSAAKLRFNMVPKQRIFENPKHLREGIELALAPLLPRRAGSER